MGQAQSEERPIPSHEEITKELAHKFAEKCFTSLEIYSFKDVFKGLADNQQNVRYLKEDTVARFLEIPDILGASPVLFQMISYMGAFPFLQDAPAVLGLEEMVIVITIMTERYKRVLAKGSTDRRKLLYKSLAVYDRKLSEMVGGKEKAQSGGEQAKQEATDGQEARTHATGFAVDEPGDESDDVDEENEDDGLVMAAFESLDYVDVFKHGNAPTIHGAMIPADNFRKLIMLLLLIAPLEPQQKLSQQSDRLVGERLEGLRTTAESILATFLNVEESPGIKFKHFNTIIPASFPYMFNGFNNLFESFLFSKNLDFTKLKDGTAPPRTLHPPEPVQPLLQNEASIMNLNVMSQLSFFIPGSTLFRRLRLLYSGDDDGFSMGSFETKVFNWRAPTILLVRGARLEEEDPDRHRHRSGGGPESAFAATLPARRFPPGTRGGPGEALTFGVYIGEPWRHTHRECFGGEDAVLFQLEPVHDVFRTSSLNRDYVSFRRPSPSAPAGHAGVSFGCPPPQRPTLQAYGRSGGSGSGTIIPLGPVSLVLDDSFEFGCFTHDHGSRGGAFRNSVSRRFDFQDRFEVQSLEVWGCGGDAEAKIQAERWAWEAREAEARRRINLGTGDIEADRALLEMAGLIGANRSGGSMA
ncbi:TLD-domain-containing protein [Phialemonium atrogriseum]|uniref:Restriction of telomere capping protein 5 n=1 Tax=Phialemonium atrogriseum TaxID=1093897 RepID=A0AAJ0FIG7_9PEZI|nr:TLD-domain-containing protein [Phialemonium atrogriseum]KAK1762090.1 TLD-domain-containing protein [Phialemonium atrogriseum]